MKVLIVDDDPDTTEVISSSFELGWPGATTVCAFDGAAGIEMALTAEPNLIVLDIGLPDINGYEVCRKIRNFSNVSIIICSVRDREMDIVMGLMAGADGYVTKPFRSSELMARAQAILRRN